MAKQEKDDWQFSSVTDPELPDFAFSVGLRHVLFATLLISIPIAGLAVETTGSRVSLAGWATFIAVSFTLAFRGLDSRAGVIRPATLMVLGMLLFSVGILALIELATDPDDWGLLAGIPFTLCLFLAIWAMVGLWLAWASLL